MDTCKIEEFQLITNLRKKTIICKENLKVGHIIDVIFDQKLNILSFIIGGSWWEEFREALGIIRDFDPVVTIDTIEEIEKDIIKLNVTKSELKDKLDEGIIPEDGFLYSDLKRRKILDSEGKNFGRINNLIILPCLEPAFILGGTWFEETSERLKFSEDIDLLLPAKMIDKIDDKTIKITLPINKLHLTLDNKPMDAESQRIYLNSQKIKGNVKMQKLDRYKVEEFREFPRFQ